MKPLERFSVFIKNPLTMWCDSDSIYNNIEGVLISKRYLLDIKLNEIEQRNVDVLIVGSGIAGVYTALQLDNRFNIAIITKESIDISNSSLAQGGIAVSLDKNDSPELHFKDTIFAGAGLCDEDNVWTLVNEAAENIENLCSFGVNFDKNDQEQLSLTREGAHSKNRIIHAGDTTGKEVCDTLISEVRKRENIKIYERTFAVDFVTVSLDYLINSSEHSTNSLICELDKDTAITKLKKDFDNYLQSDDILIKVSQESEQYNKTEIFEQNIDIKCFGVIALNEDNHKPVFYRAKQIVCASGGFGRIYSYTTNPEVATGDGVAMAIRAGAKLADMEFVQFHPTVLYHEKDRSFLISEAVRGEGAKLLNVHGERFMENYHPMLELAPRDIVSRAIFEEMKRTNSSNVFLDITEKTKEFIENRFPNIYKTCLGYGIDMSKDLIPVAPAEHYCMGGIKSDIDGKTNIDGLYACGEATANGIHGANRLASNSLLEGLVFGNRIAKSIGKALLEDDENYNIDRNKFEFVENLKKCENISEIIIAKNCENENQKDVAKLSLDIANLTQKLRDTMTSLVGIIRDENGLNQALNIIGDISDLISKANETNLDRNKSISINDEIPFNSNKLSEMDELGAQDRLMQIKEIELINMLQVAQKVVIAAILRKESRGAHFRIDFPDKYDT